MIEITNCTNEVIVICNNNISIELLGFESICIDENLLQGDSKIQFGISDLTCSRKNVLKGFKKGGLRPWIYYDFQVEWNFPIDTILNVNNVSKINIELQEIPLRKLFLIRTVNLKRLLISGDGNLKNENIEYVFINKKDKSKFLRMMWLSCAFTFPAAILCILTMIYAAISESINVASIISILVLLGFTLLAFGDFYYTIRANKWKLSPRTGGRSSDSPSSLDGNEEMRVTE